jgi:hypothetical protein
MANELVEVSPGVFVKDPILPAPDDGKLYARRGNEWVAVPDPGIGEAPPDGAPYIRQQGLWVKLAPAIPEAPAGLHGRSAGEWQKVDQQFLKEAPMDGRPYLRSGAAWVAAPADAPADGQAYARQAGAWVPAAPSSSVLTQVISKPSDTIRSDADVLCLTAVGNVTLFDPVALAIAPGKRAGQSLLLLFDPTAPSDASITIQGVSEYAHAGVRLRDGTVTLKPWDSLRLCWLSDAWVQV